MALTNAQALTRWKEAADALALGKTYQIGTRTLTRANWSEVQQAIEFYERRVHRAGDETGGLAVIEFGDPL